MLIASGKFQGCNGYKVSGAFSFDLRDEVLWFQTTEDFFFEGAPHAINDVTPGVCVFS